MKELLAVTDIDNGGVFSVDGEINEFGRHNKAFACINKNLSDCYIV